MSGRYARLKALQDYGVNVQWDKLRDKTVAIAGVGGLGAIVAEIAARVGIGKIHIFDLDVVEKENLNRMIFTTNDIGLNKVDAMETVLNRVNPDVDIIPHHGDIMGFNHEDEFKSVIADVDAALLCLDNIPARQFFNVVAVNNHTAFVDAGLLRSGLGGYVHLTKPGKNACYQCTGSVNLVATDDATGQPCSASLPSVVNIVASLQAHHLIKYFLGFGDIPDYLSYNAFTDEIRETQLVRDHDCFVCGDL